MIGGGLAGIADKLRLARPRSSAFGESARQEGSESHVAQRRRTSEGGTAYLGRMRIPADHGWPDILID